jgi:hypothetical protein
MAQLSSAANRTLSVLFVVTALTAGAGGYLLAPRKSGSAKAETESARAGALSAPPAQPAVILPERRSDDGAKPALPPELPRGCEAPPAVAVEVSVGTPNAVAMTKFITRAAHRAHVKLGTQPEAPEWLFVQNQVDPRRVSGSLIDHSKRAILEHDDTALRNSGISRGWADVVGLGVDPQLLASLTAAPTQHELGGFSFQERRASTAASALREVWWNEQLCLPLRVVAGTSERLVTTNVVKLDLKTNEELLRDPRQRFPSYQVVDAIDWLEQHHDEAGEHAHQDRPHAAP